MEGISELISRVRDHYLEQFLRFVEVQQERWPSGHAEVKFELSDQSELFHRLYCADFAAKDDDGAIVREMYPDKILTFEPVSCEVHRVPVVIERLFWDDLQVHHDVSALGNAELGRWFDYWFDIDDARLASGSETAGIVHSLFIGAGQLNMDMGTAAAEALWDILELIAAAGAEKIRVTSDRKPGRD